MVRSLGTRARPGWEAQVVQLLALPWTAACQASLFFTMSQSLFNFMFIESELLYNHLILCCPFSFCLQSFPASVFSNESTLYQVAKVLVSKSKPANLRL